MPPEVYSIFGMGGGALLNVIRRWLNNASGALRRRAGFCAPAHTLAGFAYKKKKEGGVEKI